ncbi:MAG TPA: hypothetical protein VF796_12120 [Humisphaera sp.]
MKQFRRLGVVALAAGLSVAAGAVYAADKKAPDAAGDKPKWDIETVMKKVHKPKNNSAFDKVVKGGGTAEDKALIVEGYSQMVLNSPPKGDAAAFKAKAQAVLDAAKAVQGGDAKAVATLKQAANCKACHDAHKE